MTSAGLTLCGWCGDVIEQDEGGSWAGPCQYCLKSPDHLHVPGSRGKPPDER